MKKLAPKKTSGKEQYGMATKVLTKVPGGGKSSALKLTLKKSSTYYNTYSAVATCKTIRKLVRTSVAEDQLRSKYLDTLRSFNDI